MRGRLQRGPAAQQIRCPDRARRLFRAFERTLAEHLDIANMTYVGEEREKTGWDGGSLEEEEGSMDSSAAVLLDEDSNR